MFKKVISTIMALCIICSFVSVFANNIFSDVTEENYPWAVNEIEEMAQMGIINGYSADTFGPADDVTKMQALLLASRIIGFSNENNILFVEKAYEIYEEVLAEYDIEYKEEIAYLLYKGVITTRELGVYIGSENTNLPLKRYEAAELMTKVMGAEEAAGYMTGATSFADAADIPAAAKPYVNYVSSIELMKGVENNNFAPMVNVSRAQMAVMLYRMMGIMQLSQSFGIADSVSTLSNTLTYSEYESGVVCQEKVTEDTVVLVDGFPAEINSIQPQAVVVVSKKAGELYSVEAITVKPDDKFEGVVKSVMTSSKSDSITVYPVEENSNTVTYPVSKEASVTVSGSPSSLKSVTAGMYVELDIKEGEVIIVAADKKDGSAVGTVKEIILSPQTGIVIETTKGEEEEYYFGSSIKVTRNGKDAVASDILVGDKVTLSLLYKRISKVTATSTNFSATGTIEKILIATLPQISIMENGKEVTYSLSRNAVYTLDGVDAEIYDLRLGAYVKIDVEGGTVTKVTSTAPTTSSVLTGAINTINTAYGFMIIDAVDNEGQTNQIQVFTKKSGLKIISSTTGKEMAITALKPGMTVSVTGVMNTGAFEATTVIVLP